MARPAPDDGVCLKVAARWEVMLYALDESLGVNREIIE